MSPRSPTRPGWARHTVHGFFTGLKKAGLPLEMLERVR